jgi:hypothetical protein
LKYGASVELSFARQSALVAPDPRFYGFYNIFFDEIRISISATNTAFNLDDLQFIQQTPLPAALPLFATGLGVMGLLSWRRKRKNASDTMA